MTCDDNEIEAVARALFDADEDLNDAHEAELRAKGQCFAADALGPRSKWDDPRNAPILDGFRFRARAAIAALDAVRGWRPIETAPKDGTPIIGAFWSIRWADSQRRGDVVRCWYQPEFDAFISSCREMVLAKGYTFEGGATRQLHSPVVEPVTEWMPLPQPPETAP